MLWKIASITNLSSFKYTIEDRLGINDTVINREWGEEEVTLWIFVVGRATSLTIHAEANSLKIYLNSNQPQILDFKTNEVQEINVEINEQQMKVVHQSNQLNFKIPKATDTQLKKIKAENKVLAQRVSELESMFYGGLDTSGEIDLTKLSTELDLRGISGTGSGTRILANPPSHLTDSIPLQTSNSTDSLPLPQAPSSLRSSAPVMSIEECVESVFIKGKIHYLSSALILNTYTTDTRGDLKELIMSNIKKCIDKTSTNTELRNFAILCLQKLFQKGDAAAVNELWNTCKSSWDLQPYRNIAFSELELGDKLGSGSFGTVMKGVWNRGLADKLTVAVKLIPETFQFDILDLRSEFIALSLLSHENIINMYGSGYFRQTIGNSTSEQTTWYIVMDLMKCSLADWIYKYPKKLDVLEITRIAKEIATGLEFLHRCAVIHRDIKPDNILLNFRNQVKIGDLGIVKPNENTGMNTVIGTNGYMAPELRFENAVPGSKSIYGKSVDVYAFGVVLWELFAKKKPQTAFSKKKMKYCFKLGTDCPQIFANLVKLCTKTQPSKRPAFDKIVNTLTKFYDKLKSSEGQVSSRKLIRAKPSSKVSDLVISASAYKLQGELDISEDKVLFTVGSLWQYLGEADKWQDFPPFIATIIECKYNCGSEKTHNFNVDDVLYTIDLVNKTHSVNHKEIIPIRRQQASVLIFGSFLHNTSNSSEFCFFIDKKNAAQADLIKSLDVVCDEESVSVNSHPFRCYLKAKDLADLRVTIYFSATWEPFTFVYQLHDAQKMYSIVIYHSNY